MQRSFPMSRLLRRLVLFIAPLLALFAPPSLARQAPQAASAPVPVADTAAPIRPALWRVRRGKATIYLFGTIHVLPQGIDWFGGKVATAFDKSGTLVTEIVEEDPATMRTLVSGLAVLPEGQSLRAGLSDAQRASYDAALAQYRIPAAMLDRFEPWYAAVALSTMPLMQEGFDASHGVEQLLDQRARARHIAHAGLETAAYQLGLFDKLPEDVQKSYLSEVVDQLPKLKTDITAMIAAWKVGDAVKLARIMNEGQSDPLLVKTLLTDRNVAWARWIDRRLDTPGTVFVAVGAGHLAGPGSVQEQLRALGIPVERLQ